MLARITPVPAQGHRSRHRIQVDGAPLHHRAALANGETHVTCNTTCADIEATVRCLTALGARIETVEDGFQVHPTMKSVEFGLLKRPAGGTLDCGERAPHAAYAACRLRAGRGGHLWVRDAWAHAPSPRSPTRLSPPVAPEGVGRLSAQDEGRMRPGTFELPGNVSSVVYSGLLLAAPLLVWRH